LRGSTERKKTTGGPAGCPVGGSFIKKKKGKGTARTKACNKGKPKLKAS